MSASSPASRLHVERPAGSPATVQVDAHGDPVGWATGHRDDVRAVILDQGAVLLRGLDVTDAAGLARLVQALGATLMSEREAFAPRQGLAGGVYSSTRWPANQPMCMHHELSYALEFPGLMAFGCVIAPEGAGATGVADATEVLAALPDGLVDRFEREGWLLRRTYNEEIGASWAEAFGTEDPAVVEDYCRANAIAFQWQPGGGLRTRQRRAAVVRHPVTGQRCWFNQIAFLSQWTLAPEIREYLVEVYGEEDLPFDTGFGNGDPVGEDVVDLLNDVYTAHTARRSWQAGDLLLVDNVRCAHSRESFTGPREVLVGMADPVRLADCAPTVDPTAEVTA